MFLDKTNSTHIRADQAGVNSGFKARYDQIVGNATVNSIISLNKLSFFEGLEGNMLLPSQIQFTDDATLICKNAGVDEGRVIVTKFMLWLPRIIFNSDGMSYVLENYMKPGSWSYLREIIQDSASSQQTKQYFRITDGVKNPKHIFIYLQQSIVDRPHLLNTFNLNNHRLQSGR